ncbi:MAG: hypothetical protein AB8H03_11865 [Saprospiraceae bacterium]
MNIEYRISNKEQGFEKFDNTSHEKYKTNIVKLLKSLFDIRYSIFFLILFLTSCTPTKKEITPAFYHWQTNLSLTQTEKDYLQNLSVEKLYVKFFDVDWNGKMQEPLPVAEVILDTLGLENIEIIPTVFITNRSLKNYPLEKMDLLGSNILEKIFSIKKEVQEIQIDCDWSETTEEKYFRLLGFLKKEIQTKNIQLSATIRLHQIKYFKRTGVPPVDRGMLMFYNVDDVKDYKTKNSILDLEVAKQYFFNFENYPLELDVALPIFSWGVLYRGSGMVKLINNLRAEDMADDSFFLPTDEQHFEVIKSTYLHGRYLYEGDIIRLETVSLETLEMSAELLKSKIENPNVTISFYHLDTTTIKHYPYGNLEKVIDAFE